MCIALV